MKRLDFLKHLDKYGCIFLREVANHSVYLNSETSRTSTVPRHTEIDNNLAQKICRDLGIPKSNKK